MRSAVARAMSWPKTIVAVGLLCASLCASADPLDDCRQALEQLYPEPGPNQCSAADTPVAFRSILAACPQQTAELLEHPWAPLLARSPDKLVLADLSGLHQAYQLYAGDSPRTSVDMAALPGVLAQFEQAPDPAASWWDLAWRRVLQWLQEKEPGESGWFKDISIGESVTDALLYGSVALLVILALGIVAAELRLGLAGRRSPVRSSWRDAAMETKRPLAIDDLASLPLREQPRLLLRIVLARLAAANILHLRSSATHRHITAAMCGMEQADAVTQISTAAERATFGNWEPSTAEIALLKEQGRRACNALGAGGS